MITVREALTIAALLTTHASMNTLIPALARARGDEDWRAHPLFDRDVPMQYVLTRKQIEDFPRDEAKHYTGGLGKPTLIDLVARNFWHGQLDSLQKFVAARYMLPRMSARPHDESESIVVTFWDGATELPRTSVQPTSTTRESF